MSTSPASGKQRVAIVFGGRSSEHMVSCATAAGVLEAIDRERFEVLPIGIARDGRWLLMADDPKPLQLTASQQPEVDGDTAVVVPADPAGRDVLVLEPGQPPRELGAVDVVLPLLHGPFGEDGTLQGLLELADIRYVGSGVSASAVMMDKHLMKVVFAAAGLPVGPYVVITDKEWRRDKALALDAVSSLGWPVFVKPARAGSSQGVMKVEHHQQLEAAIEAAREHDPKVIVEAAVVGREIECGVLEGHGSDRPRASEIGEIEVIGGHDFYDFEAKYIDEGNVRLSCPASIAPEVAAEVKELSVKAFEAAGCEGLARVDWFYEPGGRLVLNEINTLPGFTPQSMFPQVWAQSGLDYTALITELIELATERRTGLR
ncbi:D-alanine--D-alanine ligase [Luteipulveratus sp. YIM 133132]|uniref:D-alanine--D-alanine ligase family protein n=1 Tax=Luteipulveratus flavus TaxID=3031728 RepID=UPI0023B0FC65|nr:D-alanine--D-alanine ligase family protein [Luteipulveratus sp. YIM 133132]MDE9367844.1 D-alanine--D-alanine ligase [Luteipulveratus sp. YIM 133132]